MISSPPSKVLDAGRVRGCIFLFSCALGLTPSTAFAQVDTLVHARVHWKGPCEDQRQLAAELAERGITWLAASSEATEPQPLHLSVETEAQGLASRTQVVAHVELSDAAGRREARRIDVVQCDLLHPALALILASFAERLTREQEPPLTALSTPVAFAETTPRTAKLPQLPTRRDSRANSQLVLALNDFELRRMPLPAEKFGELRFGTHSVAGAGWGGALALGVVLQFEWQPLKHWPLWLAGGYAHLPTFGHAEGDATVAWLRRFGRIVATLQSPIPRTKVSLGAEWGSTQASASSVVDEQTVHSSWYALSAMPRIDIRLIGHTLMLHAASGLAFAPLRYTLRFEDTNRVLARSSQLEWRAELGLSVQLSASIP